jgi:NCS1 family nucleobase:cation symporter-1
MLHTIFPSIARLPNVMGRDSSLDSGGMIGFAFFWVAPSSFLIIPVPKMKPLLYAKLIVFIISAISMLGSSVGEAGGLGPHSLRLGAFPLILFRRIHISALPLPAKG